jgi:hypothetical protein
MTLRDAAFEQRYNILRSQKERDQLFGIVREEKVASLRRQRVQSPPHTRQPGLDTGGQVKFAEKATIAA